MQFAMSEVNPVPAAVASALHITIGELNATPDTPVALFVLAEIVPDTCEPWPLSSGHTPLWSSRPAWYAVPQPTASPARSGCVLSMPVSTMPTFTPPVDGNAPRPARSQPSGASISASGAPPVWPMLLRPYSSAYSGSFGVAEAFSTKFGSAYFTTALFESTRASSAGSRFTD